MIEHARRIGMTSRPYAKLASTKRYNIVLIEKLETMNQLLETRKQVAFEINM